MHIYEAKSGSNEKGRTCVVLTDDESWVLIDSILATPTTPVPASRLIFCYSSSDASRLGSFRPRASYTFHLHRRLRAQPPLPSSSSPQSSISQAPSQQSNSFVTPRANLETSVRQSIYVVLPLFWLSWANYFQVRNIFYELEVYLKVHFVKADKIAFSAREISTIRMTSKDQNSQEHCVFY